MSITHTHTLEFVVEQHSLEQIGTSALHAVALTAPESKRHVESRVVFGAIVVKSAPLHELASEIDTPNSKEMPYKSKETYANRKRQDRTM